jgi:hypothetical protein
MLNVKTLTDTMSRMQLPQLQQYAALHKNDPYIVTLALSIANQKKQMKAGQEGRAGMQPQPKVVDQELAQMMPPPQQMAAAPQQEAPAVDAMGNVTGYAGGGYLPEDQGIGQLPAPNMQGMAAGGIVAFDDGGSVPGYAGGTFTGPGTSEDYRAYALQKAAKMGLNPTLVDRIFKIESGYDPLAKSDSGSTGVGQLIKSTAQHYGLKTGNKNGQDERLNPIMNIDASLAHMAELNKKYKGNEQLIAVAYNQGEPTLDAHLRNNKGKLVPEKLSQEIATKLTAANANKKSKDQLTDAQIAKRAAEPVNYLNRLATTKVPDNAALAPGETVEPTAAAQTVDRSIPAGYKQEQAAQQAAQQPVYDADVKQLQKEGFVDKTKRVGRGLYGLGEAGTNFFGQLTTYPTAAIASAIDNPSAAYAAAQGKPGSDAFYKGMTDRQSEAIYDPRTPEGQYYNEIKNKVLSGVSPYVGHMVSGRPTSIKAAPFTGKNPKQVKPGLPGLKEAQEAKVEPKVGDQLPLFPELETAQTAPAAAPAPAFNPLPLSEASFADFAAKQAAARNKIALEQAADVAAKQEAARGAEIKPDAIPEDVGGVRPGVERGDINPQDTGLAAVAQDRIAKNQAADAARVAEEAAKPKEGIPPEVAKEPTMSVAEQLDRARAYELQKQKESVIRNRQTAVQAGLPGAAQALPAQPVEDKAQGLAPNENIDESVFDPTYGGKLPLPEKVIVDKLEDKTGKSSEELKKQADDMGMDWNSFLVRFGLGLMAGESQYASVNVGKAGLGALDAQLAEQKAKQVQALNLSDIGYKQAASKKALAEADYLDRGAKDKNLQLQAETLVQQRMEKWLSGPGKFAETISKGETAREEDRVRKAIYQQLGIQPTIVAGAPAPAGGFSVVGSRPS